MSGKAEVILGAQWGDEGKGRVVDAMAEGFDMIVRYQGGANAGHTIIAENEKYIFHLLPSGMLYSDKVCVIGSGVVVDPQQLLSELSELRSRGKDRARLVLSRTAHVVMPFHKTLDAAIEADKSAAQKIGTTSRGIGPCYTDKYNRLGIRVEDLLDEDLLREKLEINIEHKNLLFGRIYGEPLISQDAAIEQALSWGKELEPYIGDACMEINQALDAQMSVLFEGAQGTLLDVDFGTYPYVTSSSSCAGGACIGTGVSPVRINKVIGVAKAYCTRVGEGPFPTELDDANGDKLRKNGGEFGATTGRPRRCGWFDLPAMRYSCCINHFSSIALTKMDVLSGMDSIKIAVAYKVRGKELRAFPTSPSLLNEAEPVYKEMKGWREDISKCKNFDALPKAAKDYVNFLEEELKTPIKLIGVGPGRDESIVRGAL